MPIGTTGYGWAYVAQDFVTAAGGPLTSSDRDWETS